MLSRTAARLRLALRANAALPTSFAARSTMSVRQMGSRQPREPQNPGADDGRMGNDTELSTGKTWEEVTLKAKNKVRFNREPLRGPFGTLSNPVKVESGYESRVVGCLGGQGERKHSLLWFELRAGLPHACSVCGQVFELVRPAEE